MVANHKVTNLTITTETVAKPNSIPCFNKNPNKLDVVNYLKRTVLLTNGVKSIENFELYTVENELRSLGVRFNAVTSYGRIEFDEIYTVS